MVIILLPFLPQTLVPCCTYMQTTTRQRKQRETFPVWKSILTSAYQNKVSKNKIEDQIVIWQGISLKAGYHISITCDSTVNLCGKHITNSLKYIISRSTALTKGFHVLLKLPWSVGWSPLLVLLALLLQRYRLSEFGITWTNLYGLTVKPMQ